MPGYGMWYTVDVESLKKEYERVNALSPEEAQAEYKVKKKAQRSVHEIDPEKIEKVINSMDERGAWIEDITMRDFFNPWFGKRTTYRGISIRTYLRNMRTMMQYLENLK